MRHENTAHPQGVSLGRRVETYAGLVRPNELDWSNVHFIPFEQEVERFLDTETVGLLMLDDDEIRKATTFNDFRGLLSSTIDYVVGAPSNEKMHYAIEVTATIQDYAVIPLADEREQYVHGGPHVYKHLPRSLYVLDDEQTIETLREGVKKPFGESRFLRTVIPQDVDLLHMSSKSPPEERAKQVLEFGQQLQKTYGFDASVLKKIETGLSDVVTTIDG